MTKQRFSYRAAEEGARKLVVLEKRHGQAIELRDRARAALTEFERQRVSALVADPKRAPGPFVGQDQARTDLERATKEVSELGAALALAREGLAKAQRRSPQKLLDRYQDELSSALRVFNKDATRMLEGIERIEALRQKSFAMGVDPMAEVGELPVGVLDTARLQLRIWLDSPVVGRLSS